MKKIYTSLAILLLPILSFSQVGINIALPNAAAMLDVNGLKGVSFPHVSLTSTTDKATIPNPTESLIVFNTNPSIIGKEGYYYWNGNRWVFFFSEANKDILLNLTRYYGKTSTTSYNFTRSDLQGAKSHVAGETLDNSWTVFSELNNTITIDRPINQSTVTLSGMLQINNTNIDSLIESSFGLFVDDVLVDVKPFLIPYLDTCNYKEITLYFSTDNIAVGNHTIKIAMRNRTSTSTENWTLTVGGKNASCSTLTNDEARMSSTIFITQPYDNF